MLDDFSDLSDNDDTLLGDRAGADSLMGNEELSFEDLDDYADYDGSLDDFEDVDAAEKPKAARRRSSGLTLPTLNLTGQQRFIISLLLFLSSCLFSMLCLLLTNKIII